MVADTNNTLIYENNLQIINLHDLKEILPLFQSGESKWQFQNLGEVRYAELTPRFCSHFVKLII